MWIELLVVAAIAFGTFFVLVASIGVWRLQDFYMRVHAPTKAATLGLIFLLLATALTLAEPRVATKAILAMLFIFATAPVAAHVLARAAYRARVPSAMKPDPDEYAPVVEKRRAEAGPGHREAADLREEYPEKA